MEKRMEKEREAGWGGMMKKRIGNDDKNAED